MHVTDILTQPFVFVTLVAVWFVIFAWLIDKAFSIVIRYFVAKTKTTADDKLVPVIKNSLLAGLFVTALYIVSLYLMIPTAMHIIIEKGFFTALIIIASFFLSSLLSIILIEINERSYAKNGKHTHSAVPFMNNMIKIGIFSGGALLIMRMFNIDVTPALASAGVAGIAVAFAAKDFVANLFGGISVFFDKPYTIGDYVIINELYRGEVMEIGMRSTKIRTRDAVLLTVPNSVMVTNIVVNETGYEPRLRVRIPIQVGYESDLDKVENVLNKVANAHDEVLEQPAPRVRYRNFHDSGISLELLVVIAKPAHKGHITHELIKEIHLEFIKSKIRIPFPRRDVFMHTVK